MNRYPVKQKGPIEAWLRPPSELWAALLHGAVAALCALAPWALLMPPSVAWPTAAVFGVRLAILVLALPLFALAALDALGEGLLARDLRRWDGGRESSYRYHFGKKAVKPALALPWVLYLSAPVSVHPLLVLLPCVVAFGIAVAVTVGSFKKYF